jgi:lysozyme family protein
MQAPHVFQDGHICHGTLAIGMTNAYKKRDLYQLVLQLILFLQQANTDDAAGKYVNCWPEISEEMIRLQEQKATEKEPEKAEFINKPEDQHFDEVLAGAIPV